ncbi:hypothetical protein [Streptomyces microflavus]|uniref:phage tail tube protein n=1 Tax=Streptomyces microflavus TaxID=1919 RepID=UPI003B217EF6
MGRFNRKGVTKILFAESIADAGYMPTLVEVTGAEDYTKAIAAVDGFSIENQEIETPTWTPRSCRRSPAMTPPPTAR